MGESSINRSERQVHMGLGEAVLRLVHVELKYANGIFDIPDYLKQEREMIVLALNQFQLELGFDCNNDGVADGVGIFKQTAETSCCRILPRDTSRRASSPVVPNPKSADPKSADPSSKSVVPKSGVPLTPKSAVPVRPPPARVQLPLTETPVCLPASVVEADLPTSVTPIVVPPPQVGIITSQVDTPAAAPVILAPPRPSIPRPILPIRSRIDLSRKR